MEGTEISHVPSTLSIVNIPRQSGMFVATDGPAPTYHYHPKSVVHTAVHSGLKFLGAGYTLSGIHSFIQLFISVST